MGSTIPKGAIKKSIKMRRFCLTWNIWRNKVKEIYFEIKTGSAIDLHIVVIGILFHKHPILSVIFWQDKLITWLLELN